LKSHFPVFLTHFLFFLLSLSSFLVQCPKH
jgi:hypothetical protein